MIYLFCIVQMLPVLKDTFYFMKNKEVFNFIYWFEKYMNIMNKNDIRLMLNLQNSSLSS